MGGGSWTTTAFCNYMSDTGKTVKRNYKGYASSDDILNGSVQDFYKSRGLAEELNPYKVCRECRDTEEHPNTIPVIFALDVTGSMGESAKVCAGKLDEIMGELYEEVTDVEFMMMGIGDLVYDHAPIQASQFESDIRILDQTGKIYFEAGGGPNLWESYTAAWYFALHNTDLDCWKRGKKGIIITLGDEMLNPNLERNALNKSLGYLEQSDVDTKELYKEVCEKFDIWHIGITDSSSHNYKRRDGQRGEDIRKSWTNVIGQGYVEGKCKDLPLLIKQIVSESVGGVRSVTEDGLIKW